MWISNEYYEELLKTLHQFSQGCFDFEEYKLKSFNTRKYDNITNALLKIKKNQKKQIDNLADLTDFIIDGNYDFLQTKDIDANDYKILYKKYNSLVKHLEKINKHISILQKTITQNGKIGTRINDSELNGKWLEMVLNLNLILESLSTPIDEITTIINNVAKGNLTNKMRLKIDNFEISGDFLNLATTINTMVDQLALFASEVTRVAKEVGTDGLLGGQAKVDGVSGTWLDLTNNVNDMADSLTLQVRNTADVITAVAKGDLSQKITVDAKGEILELKGTINAMVDQLALFASEVTRVAKEVGTDGLLGGQAKVDGVSGTWLDLTNNVNDMADSLTLQVRNTADVITAVAKGDLSQKITVDAKGEILELKGTINAMVDQLALFASEVTRVAKEVGTDGLLGGQAKVDGVSGTWLDLTNNVNDMADSLTLQVRNILDVAIAVAKGDLTRQIDIDVKGELLELKNNINTMIAVLSNSDTKNRNQNWIKDGVSLLNKEVLDKDSLSKQIQAAITLMARYVDAGMGALYIYNPDKKTLKLEASYAYTKRNNLSNEFKLGEGIVGQVAYEKKPILLTNIVDNAKITTALTEYNSLNTYTAPLIFKDELIGVVEIASYEHFDDVRLEYFKSALSTLSGSLYASLQSSSTKDLLTQSQAQSEELKNQSLRLKNQNEELELQRVELDKQKLELEKKNEDLKNAQIEISRAKEIELANKYKSEFLANMSHELRTPLNSMLLLSSSLANSKKLDIEKVNKQASIIYNAGNGLLNLINDVLDLSKIEANLMTLNIENVKTKNIIKELYELFTPQAEEKNITLQTYISEDVAQSFVTDRVKLTQILKNFLSNAIKFTDKGGTVKINIEKNDDEDRLQREIKISVIDNGVGIEEDKIDLIFEAFRQADGSTSRKYGGTGLGLSISKEFAKLLGCQIKVKSKPNEGSTFYICVPEKIDTKNVSEELIENIDTKNEPINETKNKNTLQRQIEEEAKELVAPIQSMISKDITNNEDVIMVVDDDKTFSNIIIDAIGNLGYQAIVAHDGNSAVSLARDYKPKAILLDLVLPGLNGIEVLRVLKADLDTRHIPIKVISFNDAFNDTKKLGAVDFIQKPVSANILDKTISTLMDFVHNEQKHILSLQNENDQIAHLLEDKNIKVSIAQDVDKFKKLLESKDRFDCVIFDANLNLDINELLEFLHTNYKSTNIVAYSKDDFNNKQMQDIKKYCDNLILKTAVGEGKLIEEVSLFLNMKKNKLNEQNQKLLSEVMTQDELLENKKVLIVDDDVRNIFALSAILEDKGMQISSANNGEEAVEMLTDEDNDFDIILMDIMMPVMDGYEAIKNIRKIDRFKTIPIITLTAKAQKEDKQTCLDAGANDYLTKPINNDRLIYLMKVWTKSAQ